MLRGHCFSVLFVGALATLNAAASPPSLALGAELGRPATVIESAELATYGESFYELEEALAAREGVTFLSSGDVGSEDWILVRGLPRDSSRNVLVLLDGAPINNAAYEGVEAHDLPASHIDRVEIHRPPLPARFGGYHAVIAFYTKRRRDDGTAAHARGALGSLSTERASVGVDTTISNLSLDASLSTLSTDALSGRFRTPPFENLRYEDRSYWDWVPTLRAEWRPSEDTIVSSFGTFSKGEKRFSDDEYRTRWFALSGVLAAHRASDALVLRGAAHAGYERYFLRLRMHPDVGLQFRRRLGARVEAVITPADESVTLIGGELSERRLDERGALSRLTSVAAFAEQRLQPLPELELGGGVRIEGARTEHSGFAHAHDVGTGIAWSARASASPWTTGSVGVRVGRTLRLPALGEFSGHVELEPEILTGGEIRARQELLVRRLSVELTAYALQLEREVENSESGLAFNSRESKRSRGLEARLDARASEHASVYVTYTLSEVVDSRGRPIAFGAPEQMASAGVLFSKDGTRGRLSARYLGEKEGILRHMGEEGRIQDALLLDVFAERRLVHGLSAFVQGQNLMNLTYETFQGRPMMPRTVLIGVEIEQEL